MPQYQFFEPKKTESQQKEFNQFHLSMGRGKKVELSPEGQKFVALSMPKFEDSRPTMKTPKKLTQFEEFRLTTNIRGSEKSSVLQKKMDDSEKARAELANFKAQPVKFEKPLNHTPSAKKNTTECTSVLLASEERSK